MPEEHMVTVPGSTIFPVTSSVVNSTLYCHSKPCANAGIADVSKKLITGRAILEIRKKVDAVQSVKPNVCLLVIVVIPRIGLGWKGKCSFGHGCISFVCTKMIRTSFAAAGLRMYTIASFFARWIDNSNWIKDVSWTCGLHWDVHSKSSF